jgi:hypothetical protein
MKKIIFTIMAFVAFVSFNACEEENNLVFTAQPSAEGVEFLTSAAAEYLLSSDTQDNIAERFVWNVADFGTETNVNYDLEGSLTSSFDEVELLGSTNTTNLSITVKQLLTFAKALGLDDDPSTTDGNGQPNNTGEVFVRLRAYAGNGTGNAVDMYSSTQSLAIKIVEKTGDDSCPSIWIVGDAMTDFGWTFSDIGEVYCSKGVFQRKFTFKKGLFRLFQTFDSWDTNNNYAYYEGEGYAIDSRLVSQIDGGSDANFEFIGDSGIYTLTVDDSLKTITLTPSGSLWAVGDVPGGWNFIEGETIEFIEITPDVWQASIALTNGVFRFFQIFGTWDTNNNYAYYEDEGYTIDSNFENDGGDDANFKFIGTPGTYTITINAIEKTITLD